MVKNLIILVLTILLAISLFFQHKTSKDLVINNQPLKIAGSLNPLLKAAMKNIEETKQQIKSSIQVNHLEIIVFRKLILLWLELLTAPPSTQFATYKELALPAYALSYSLAVSDEQKAESFGELIEKIDAKLALLE